MRYRCVRWFSSLCVQRVLYIFCLMYSLSSSKCFVASTQECCKCMGNKNTCKSFVMRQENIMVSMVTSIVSLVNIYCSQGLQITIYKQYHRLFSFENLELNFVQIIVFWDLVNISSHNLECWYIHIWCWWYLYGCKLRKLTNFDVLTFRGMRAKKSLSVYK